MRAAALLGVAASLWMLAGGLMLSLPEEPAPVPAAERRVRAGFGYLRSDPAFRRFVIARALLSGTVLMLPYLVLLAREASPGRDASLLGAFLVAGSLATALSGAVWGHLADRSSRRTLIAAGLASGTVALASLLVPLLDAPVGSELATYVVLFFLLALGHTGIRQGRKTFLIDMADHETRPTYTAVANVLVGAALLGVGVIGSLLGEQSPHQAILGLASLGLLGALVALGLPEVEGEPRD